MQEKIFFQNSKKSKLCGIISNPSEDNSKPIIILAHGFSTTKNSPGIVALGEKLNNLRISTFKFDFYGHGESEGKFEDITVSEGVDDILSAIKFIKNKGYKKIGLVGSSFGGICSTLASSKSKDLFVLALKSPVSDFVEVENIDLSKKAISEWKKSGKRIYCPKRNLKLNYSFYEDALKLNVYRDAKKINIPTIIVHGDKDEIVPVKQSFELVKSIETSKLIVVKDADHRYSEKKSFDAVIKLISEFIEKNI